MLLNILFLIAATVLSAALCDAQYRYVHAVTACDETSDGKNVRVHRCLGGNDKSDVKRATLDPFIVFDAYRNTEASQYAHGFPAHPHRGFLELRYITQGALRHNDSCGGSGVTRAGGIQALFAGRGIVHEELPVIDDTESCTSASSTDCQRGPPGFFGFQVWVNVPSAAKKMAPQFAAFHSFPLLHLSSGAVITMFSGVFPHQSPLFEGPISAEMEVQTGLLFFEVELQPHHGWLHVDIPSSQHVVVYVTRGAGLQVGDDDEEPVRATELGYLGRGEQVRLRAASGQACRFILLTAPRIKEPVVVSGGFVASSRSEIDDAFDDLASGHSTHC